MIKNYFRKIRSFNLIIDQCTESSLPLQDKYQLQIHQLYDNIIPDSSLVDKVIEYRYKICLLK